MCVLALLKGVTYLLGYPLRLVIGQDNARSRYFRVERSWVEEERTRVPHYLFFRCLGFAEIGLCCGEFVMNGAGRPQLI